MNIGGRIFQQKLTLSNSEKEFKAKYKGFSIEVLKISGDDYEMKKYSVEVRDKKNIPFFRSMCTRCKIHDAVVFALNESGVK